MAFYFPRSYHIFKALHFKCPLKVVLDFGRVLPLLGGPGVRREDPDGDGLFARGPGQLDRDALDQGLQTGVFVDLSPAGEGPDHRQEGGPARDPRLLEGVQDALGDFFLVPEGPHQKGHGLGLRIEGGVLRAFVDAGSSHHRPELFVIKRDRCLPLWMRPQTARSFR